MGWVLVQLSPEVIDLLDQMLCLNPHRRISMAAVMEHPWVNK